MLRDMIKEEKFNIANSNFTFSATKIDDLEASEYTLVTICIDMSSSVSCFYDDIIKSIKTIIDACKKSPRAENLMVRILTFNSNLTEIHGFRILNSIDVSDYDKLNRPNGMTALFDATYSGVMSTIEYSEKLMNQDYLANGIIFVLTDGCDNQSKTAPKMISDIIDDALKSETKIESIVTILMAINLNNDAYVMKYLEKFKNDAKFNEYINIGDATPQNLAKMADFVSKSISSTSQALGTGGPSQNLSF